MENSINKKFLVDKIQSAALLISHKGKGTADYINLSARAAGFLSESEINDITIYVDEELENESFIIGRSSDGYEITVD